MTPGAQPSTLDIALNCLGAIWSPGAEAFKLQQTKKIRSMTDLAAEAERAGYLVDEVDLPANVGGFALLIDGEPHIVVNRAKSAEYREYTVAHELAHHMLHLAPSNDFQQFPFSNKNMMEFQANAFAAGLVVWVTPEAQREPMLRDNPELVRTLAMSVFLSVATVLVALIANLWFRSNSAASIPTDRR